MTTLFDSDRMMYKSHSITDKVKEVVDVEKYELEIGVSLQ